MMKQHPIARVRAILLTLALCLLANPANAAPPAVKIIADFADGKIAPFEDGVIVRT